MEEEKVGNNEKTTKLGGVTGKGFMPGVSGNPSGRPKDTLKAFIAKELREMSDDEKREWLKTHNISGLDQWKMGEGNPQNNVEVKGNLTISQVLDELEDERPSTQGQGMEDQSPL